MSASFNMFKTHCAASGIEHSTSGNFTSPDDINLIVAKNNIIEIYKLPQETSKNEHTKLILIARYRLFGEVQCIKCARFVPNHCDSLLITFPDAKLSVIDFDSSRRSIVSKALFNFDPLHRRIGNITSCHNLKLRVDPLQRCAALLVAQDLIFILPLFAQYLVQHKQRKHSNPIHVPLKDTLANEHQQEIDDEEQRLNPDRDRNHNTNARNNHRNNTHRHKQYVSPLPPPASMLPNGGSHATDKEEDEQEDTEYIKSIQGDDDSSGWDAAYQKGTCYHYKSLCSKGYFIINLRAKCEKIVDFIFLDGYNTPQILMLFEKTATWGGRIPVRSKNISLLSITVNVVHKKYNVPFILWDILSHDFNKLHPIPSSSNILHSSLILEQVNKHKNKYVPNNIGGAFLIGSHAILHFGQNIDFGLSFNNHGDVLSKDFVLLRRWTERVINLEHCVMSTLWDERHCDFILSDGVGFMYLLSIQSGKINLSTLGIGPIACTMTSLKNYNGRFVFVGSRLAHSLLLCHQTKKPKPIEITLVETEEKTNTKPMSQLQDTLFGKSAANEDNTDPNSNNRKRTYSEMNVDEANKEDNVQLDLAFDLFGVSKETLADQAAGKVVVLEANASHKQRSASPVKSLASHQNTPLRHQSLYGPKVKRRKLSNKAELQMHELDFMNVVDFSDERLFEIEIEREHDRVYDDSENSNEHKRKDQENEAQIAEYRRIEKQLRDKYEFRIHDTITNLSPITSVVMAKSHDSRFLHSEYINLMAATSYGPQAKLSIVQEGIRPQILAKTNTNHIVSGVACWALYKPEAEPETESVYHSYLVVTDMHQTQVLDVGDKIKVIEANTAFIHDTKTIACGHIGSKQRLTAQIYAHGVRLIRELEFISEYKSKEGEIIMDGYICDPFVLLHLEDKTVRLLTYKSESNTLEASNPDLARFKEINEIERDRRKREFVSRRCNRMQWDQYLQLEKCIDDFLSVFPADEESQEQHEKDMNALIQYIEETLVKKQGEKEENEEKKTNSMKEEADDDDNEPKPSTGWQNTEWNLKRKKDKTTLFSLNLSIETILKRLFGKQLDDTFHKAPKDILYEMITKDLDCGPIERIHLYQYSQIKTKTLQQLNTEYLHTKRELTQQNAATFQQLLTSSFQTKRLDFEKQKYKQRKLKRKENNTAMDEMLMREIYFGDSSSSLKALEEAENNMEIEEDTETHKDASQTFAVIARTSGTLQIFKIPEFKLVFECSEIHIGHEVLVNNLIHDESLQIIMSKHQLTKRRNLADFIEEETENKVSANEEYYEDELIPDTLKDELWCSSTNIYNDLEDEHEYERRAVDELYVNTIDNHPYLLVFLSNGDLLIYQMYQYFQGGHTLLSKIGRNLKDKQVHQMEILPMRMNRFAHKLFTRKKYNDFKDKQRKIYPMHGINGLKGVLIAANHPAIILSHRGSPIVHDFSIDDDIRGFCVFNHPQITNVAQDKRVTNGCVYFNEYGLTIATIPKSIHNIACNANVFKDLNIVAQNGKQEADTDDKKDTDEDIIVVNINNKTEKDEPKKTNEAEIEEEPEPIIEREIFGHSFVLMKQRINASQDYVDIDYNFEYPVAHIPLCETLHFMVQHPQSGTYLLIMSRYKEISGTEMLKTRDIRAVENYFECRLLNPYKWRFDDRLTGFIIHQNTQTDVSIPVSEHILCGKSVTIQEASRIGSQTVVSKNLIVLGTGTNQGEDSASIGRIVMLEIIPEKECQKLQEIRAPNTNKNERDERFYTRTKHNSDRLLSEHICEPSLEHEHMNDIYLNSSDLQKKYYRKELSYYKKCMQQDKSNNIRYRIHYVFARRERAAVTAINCVNGLIVAAIGPKLLLFRWDGTQLIGCAFLDTRIHCHNILVLKNFVLTTDLFQGLDLYHWEQDIASIVKLARDVQYRSIYSVHWCIHRDANSNNKEDRDAANNTQTQNQFEFLVSDMHQNLQIISYEPHLLHYGFLSKIDKEKLYTRCLFHIGCNISDSIIMKFRNTDKHKENDGNYFNLNACTDGSINYLIPISEQIYRRLSALHSQMIFYCHHYCGLNPREYRHSLNNCIAGKDTSRQSHIMHNHSALNSIHGKDRSATITSKNIVDHDLVERFLNLDYRTQYKLTTNIGVRNSNVIINHLSQLFQCTKWF